MTRLSVLAQALYAWPNQLYWKPSGVVALYSCHRRNKVTPLRLSSWCTVDQSGARFWPGACAGSVVVCVPQEEQGEALAFELVVHRGPVGGQVWDGTCGWGWRKQPLLQRGRIEPVGQWPGQAHHLGALHVGRDGGAAQAKATGNLPITEPDRPF